MFVKTILGCLILAAGSFGLTVPQSCQADQPLSSSATVDLQMAVARMNGWLRGSSHESGWRRYLHLNQLDAQCALGEYAQVVTLQKVLDRFSGNVDGLDTPEFNDVRIALSQQIALLSANHPFDLNQAVRDAISKYRRVSISDLEMARATAAYELRLLKRYYRKTMDSRPRAELFYKLKLDDQIEYLEGLKFELPPEVSAGKTRSMIRDEQKKLKTIEEEIDALPVDEDDDEDYDDDDGDETETSVNDKDKSNPDIMSLSPIITPPGPDDGKDTLKELETRAATLEEQIDNLKQIYRDLKAADADRVARRTGVLNQLADFNECYDEVTKDHFDPWLVSTALAAEHFNFLYFYATDDNLQEEFLERIGALSDLLQESPDLSDRAAHGEAGKLLQWLERAGQAPQLVALIRSQHSQPNLYASISSGMINSLVAENAASVSRRQRVKEVFFGRIIRGTANIDGDISVVLNPDPYQINLAIELLGSITSQTYSREREWTVRASAAGTFSGRRQFVASLRGLDASDVQSEANVASSFGGISSRNKLVKRKACETYLKQKSRSDAESTRRIKAQVTEGFVESTDKALESGQNGIAALGERMDEFARFIPPLFVRTLQDRIELVARKTNQGSLGSPSAPAHYGRQDEISVAIHETMLTNYLDPVFAGKTFTNEELKSEAKERFGIEIPDPKQPESNSEDGDGEKKAEEPISFSITFDRVRPIQLEFKDDQLAVIVTGRKFTQGSRAIRAGLRFRLNFRIVRQGGTLKLFRFGDTEIEYSDPDKKSAKLVAFRSLLEKRLNETTQADEGVTIPNNLIPATLIEGRPMLQSLTLNTLRMDGGWMYLSWNRGYRYASDLAGIWDEGTMSVPALPEEPEAIESKPPEPYPVTTTGGDWNSRTRESTVSVLEPVPIEQGPVILIAAEGSIVPGQMIEGEIVHEFIIDGTASEIPVSVLSE